MSSLVMRDHRVRDDNTMVRVYTERTAGQTDGVRAASAVTLEHQSQSRAIQTHSYRVTTDCVTTLHTTGRH